MQDGRSITTSLKVGEVFVKQHYNVLRDIETLDCLENFRALNFEATFRNVPVVIGCAEVRSASSMILKTE